MSTSLPRPGLWSYPTCYYPVLPGDEATGADGYVGELKCLHNGLCYVRPDVDVSCLGQHSACLEVSALFVPLYKVVRIHGSVG